jgi:hypothetical protein
LADWDLEFEGTVPRNYIIILMVPTNGPVHWGPTNWVVDASDVLKQLGEYGWDLVCYDPNSKQYIVKRPADVWHGGDFMVNYSMVPKP